MAEATHTIFISDPWHLEVTEGSNPLLATAIGVLPGPDHPNWQGRLLLLDVLEPFRCRDELVTQVLCSPRYKGDPMFLARYLSCTVGISRVRPGYSYTAHSSVVESEIDYFAIGEIRVFSKLLKAVRSKNRSTK